MSAAADFLVLAQRLPVHRTSGSRGPQWERSPGGLVSALLPILRERRGTWIGGQLQGLGARLPEEHEGIRLVPVRISPQEHDDYYEGFSNQTLWPLYHDAIRPAQYERRWWDAYQEVNRRFARTAAEIAGPGATVWVHDYHLQLVPALLRELRPDLRIGFFLHIPFPPKELFEQLPWRVEILQGLLGAGLVGFQRQAGARNFAWLARIHAAADSSPGELRLGQRTVRYGSFPISIDFQAFDREARSEAVARRRQAIQARFGQGRRILLGIDRLDYTKGIDNRLRAYHALLQSRSVDAGHAVLVQVAVPSREHVRQYEEQRAMIEGLVGRINGEFSEIGRIAVNYLRRSFSMSDLVALYRSADVMLVTPLRDGMNLVAKEYVASRVDDSGVLVLSEFTGAAGELKSALIVNPHDVEGMAESIRRALALAPEEQRRRMRHLRRKVRAWDVGAWARSFLEQLSA